MKLKGIYAAGGAVLSALLSMLLVTGVVRAAENELGWTLDSALKQVDRQSKDFSSLLAEVTVVTTDASGKVTRERAGRMYMNKDGDMRLAVGDGSGQVVLVSRSEVQEYDPAKKQVVHYSLSRHKERLEPYARLGFTNTGKDLTDDYLVTMLGEDHIRGERTLQLQLTPKKDSQRQVVGSVTIWINEASWMPMRQVIEEVSNGEVLTVDYQGAARNLNLNPGLFRSNWPRGTKRVNE